MVLTGIELIFKQVMEGISRFSSETMPLFASDVLISLIDFIGDLLLLYRCWMVWSKNYWIILLPLLTAVGGFGQ